jgi:hypothetical protein
MREPVVPAIVMSDSAFQVCNIRLDVTIAATRVAGSVEM